MGLWRIVLKLCRRSLKHCQQERRHWPDGRRFDRALLWFHYHGAIDHFRGCGNQNLEKKIMNSKTDSTVLLVGVLIVAGAIWSQNQAVSARSPKIRRTILLNFKPEASAAQIQEILKEVRKNISSLRSEEHTSELQSLRHLVCRLLLEKNN